MPVTYFTANYTIAFVHAGSHANLTCAVVLLCAYKETDVAAKVSS